MDSILDFWYQMTANPLLFVAVILTLGVFLVNGWTDAPNAIATCVVTRCMPPKLAILMAAVWSQWLKVIYGIVISVVLGFGLAWLICKLVTKIFEKANRPKTEPFFKGAQIVGSAAMAFMHGAQDGQKFMGIILLCVFTLQSAGSGGDATFAIPTWLMILCSAVMGAGTAMGGKKIIKSVGMDMVKLEKYQGFSADIASSLALVFCSVFGLPVSTTHVKTTAIMGVGAVKRVSAINFGVVKEMVLTWVLTFPGCGLLAFLVTKLFLMIFN